jgi:hypothetical protein
MKPRGAVQPRPAAQGWLPRVIHYLGMGWTIQRNAATMRLIVSSAAGTAVFQPSTLVLGKQARSAKLSAEDMAPETTAVRRVPRTIDEQLSQGGFGVSMPTGPRAKCPPFGTRMPGGRLRLPALKGWAGYCTSLRDVGRWFIIGVRYRPLRTMELQPYVAQWTLDG